MIRIGKRRLAMVTAGVGVLAACLTIRYYWGTGAAQATPGEEEVPSTPVAGQSAPPSQPTQPSSNTRNADSNAPELKIVAAVNGEDISRQEFAEECLRHYGKDVLEKLTNKYLIVAECQRRSPPIRVEKEEVNAEIERMAKRFGWPTDQWLKLLKQERGIKPAQYASDIIWPTVALRKIAGARAQVTAAEVQAEYDRLYGPAVQARLIAMQDFEKAQKVRALAAAAPEEFGNLAKKYSDDAGSASLKGIVQPIHRHSGNKEIEDAVFALRDGEVSQIVPVTGQFVILLRERLLQSENVPMEKVKDKLEELVREQKLRDVAADVFRDLQKNAQVKNVYNDPVLAQQMPGVVALINGNQVTKRELAERCIERHGEEVLEGTINRKILEQACKKNRITITDADLSAEVALAASRMVKSKPDGSPDVETWLKTVTAQQRITLDLYYHDAVWPSVALKKLVGEKVEITREDLQRGFEANYGPRVRCLAMLLNNLQQAKRVWEMARKDPSPEFFGKLAEQYSCEANNRAMKGEVPPIQKHGGQPLLEEAAFELKPGELSHIIQVAGGKPGDQRYVILLCLGQTKPVNVDFASVKDLIHNDIREKKLRLAMADTMEHLQKTAAVDNLLAGTIHQPERSPSAPRDGSTPETTPRMGSVLPSRL